MLNKKSIIRNFVGTHKMGKSADYSVVKVESDRVFLIDLNLGNRSVTNDAESVFSKIKKIFPDHRVIYRDSMGRWDEIVLDEELSNPSEFPDSVVCGFVCYDEYVPSEDEILNFPTSLFIK